LSAAAASLPSPSSVQGLKVIDFGLGLTGALIAKQFAELGAQVSRIEPAEEIRFTTCTRLTAIGAGVSCENRRIGPNRFSRIQTVHRRSEDFPGITHDQNAESLSRRYPRLIVLRILSYPGDEAAGVPPSICWCKLAPAWCMSSSREDPSRHRYR